MEIGSEIPIGISELCFGCGRKNPCGLKLRFEWDGKRVTAEFTPTELHQGWEGIIHGGIITTMLDEAMGYATYYEGIMGVTGAMQLRFRHPASIGQPLIVTASMSKNMRRLAEAAARVTLKDGSPAAEEVAPVFN